jgi:hypothetical protein
MKFTNNTNLPGFVHRMVTKDNYPKHSWDTFSVTELFKGPKEIILSRRFADDIEVDIADMAAILLGNALHEYLEGVVKDSELSEERLAVPLDTKYGTVYISGAFDLYDYTKQHIYDLKSSAAMSIQFKKKDNFADWKKQLRTYWWLLQRAGFPVRSASNLVVTAGHSKYQSRKNPDYPKHSIIEIKHDLPAVFNGEEEADMRQEYTEKIEQVLKYKDVESDLIPACSPEERWERDECWAIMKKGRKTAVKRHFSEFDAEVHLANLDDKHYIEHRPGMPTKCVDYCWANQQCSFYRNYMGQQETTTKEHKGAVNE